ncbi:MAG: hypothetical protein JWQ72_3646 [Polaromonas sp.]|nr:hypothetical protein [Polaromonas sp.]
MKHRPTPLHYSKLHALLASPTQPMAAARRNHQLTIIWQGLAALETAPAPTVNDWRVCSDAANMMETLITQGIATDADGLLADAIAALAHAGKRHYQGQPIRLDGPGITAVRGLLEDYAQALAQLPERTMVECHRQTEARLKAIHSGKRQPHDVEVMAL